MPFPIFILYIPILYGTLHNNPNPNPGNGKEENTEVENAKMGSHDSNSGGGLVVVVVAVVLVVQVIDDIKITTLSRELTDS